MSYSRGSCAWASSTRMRPSTNPADKPWLQKFNGAGAEDYSFCGLGSAVYGFLIELRGI